MNSQRTWCAHFTSEHHKVSSQLLVIKVHKRGHVEGRNCESKSIGVSAYLCGTMEEAIEEKEPYHVCILTSWNSIILLGLIVPIIASLQYLLICFSRLANLNVLLLLDVKNVWSSTGSTKKKSSWRCRSHQSHQASGWLQNQHPCWCKPEVDIWGGIAIWILCKTFQLAIHWGMTLSQTQIIKIDNSWVSKVVFLLEFVGGPI